MQFHGVVGPFDENKYCAAVLLISKDISAISGCISKAASIDSALSGLHVGLSGTNASNVIASLNAALSAAQSAQNEMKTWFLRMTGMNEAEMNLVGDSLGIFDRRADDLANFYYNKGLRDIMGGYEFDEDGFLVVNEPDYNGTFWAKTTDDAANMAIEVMQREGITIDKNGRIYDAKGNKVDLNYVYDLIEKSLDGKNKEKFDYIRGSNQGLDYIVIDNIKEKQGVPNLTFGEQVEQLGANATNTVIATTGGVIKIKEGVEDANTFYLLGDIEKLLESKRNNGTSNEVLTEKEMSDWFVNRKIDGVDGVVTTLVFMWQGWGDADEFERVCRDNNVQNGTAEEKLVAYEKYLMNKAVKDNTGEMVDNWYNNSDFLQDVDSKTSAGMAHDEAGFKETGERGANLVRKLPYLTPAGCVLAPIYGMADSGNAMERVMQQLDEKDRIPKIDSVTKYGTVVAAGSTITELTSALALGKLGSTISNAGGITSFAKNTLSNAADFFTDPGFNSYIAKTAAAEVAKSPLTILASVSSGTGDVEEYYRQSIF